MTTTFAHPTNSAATDAAFSADSVFSDERELDSIFAVLDDVDRAIDSVQRDEPSSAPSTPWVLCIDDDADFTATLRRRLHADGVQVISAANGLDGFQMAFTNPARAILLDYNMPHGAGDYVLDRLKRNPMTLDIPVIVVTGNRDRQLQRRMLARGAAAYLTKPVDYGHLLAELEKHGGIKLGAEAAS